MFYCDYFSFFSVAFSQSCKSQSILTVEAFFLSQFWHAKECSFQHWHLHAFLYNSPSVDF